LAAESNDGKAMIPEACQTSRAILCIPGFTKLDEAAAIVLAQVLRRKGYGASAEQSDAMSISKFFSLDLAGTELICICYVDQPSSAKLHYAVRRLTKKTKSAYIIALSLDPAAEEIIDKVAGLPALTKTFAEASESVRRDHAGLHSFLSMSLIEARRRNASALRLRFSPILGETPAPPEPCEQFVR
jgi:hypothetical protein